ncbi:MAG TPA: radical SAM protein [Planctomycetota bacterium]|nr:radical SAM protein [Planctomycetota bacterium]
MTASVWSAVASKLAARALGRRFTPPVLHFLVNSVCELRCQHCFFWRDLEDKGIVDLSLDEVRRIAASLDDLFYLVLAGGEPYLRPDLFEIVETFVRGNALSRLVVISDGWGTERIVATATRILEAFPDLHFTACTSLDGLEPVHDEIRGRAGSFARAVATVRRLQALKARFPRLAVQTLTTYMSLNEAHAEPLYAWLRDELRPDKIGLNLIRQDPRNPATKAVDVRGYERLARRIADDTLAGRRSNRYPGDAGAVTAIDLVMHDLVAKTARTGRCQLTCEAGVETGVLYSDGRLATCEILEPLGNLRDHGYDVRALWHSREADAARRRIRAGCRCTHESSMLASIPFNAKLIPKLVSLQAKVMMAGSARAGGGGGGHGQGHGQGETDLCAS